LSAHSETEIVDILIVGSGGRESTFAWKLKQSIKAGGIFFAPGNAGVAMLDNVEIATCDGKPIKADDIDALLAFAQENHIGLTIVGPELPLCMGIVDRFREQKLRIFGPPEAAARLEESKAFALEEMKACGVPIPRSEVYTDYDQALGYVTAHGAPIVIKADGLCGGKGVYVCHTIDDAKKALEKLMLDKKFKEAGTTVIIQDFVKGHEFSFMAVSDGKRVVRMIGSQDHKQVGKRAGESTTEGDVGPMTGGMGAFAPVSWVTDAMLDDFVTQYIEPMLKHLKEKYQIVYTGCLYIALMHTDDGIRVLEWNARFGDPETQAVLALMKSALLESLLACTNGTLGDLPPIEWHDNQHAACVALCEDPYPDTPKGGYKITGIEEAEKIDGVTIIYAGVGRDADGNLITAGGRVLYVICVADSLKAAQKGANKATETIQFEKKKYRRDIGNREQPMVA